MPFPFKLCLKFPKRKSRRKLKIDNTVKPFEDAIVQVTKEDILKGCRSRSSPSNIDREEELAAIDPSRNGNDASSLNSDHSNLLDQNGEIITQNASSESFHDIQLDSKMEEKSSLLEDTENIGVKLISLKLTKTNLSKCDIKIKETNFENGLTPKTLDSDYSMSSEKSIISITENKNMELSQNPTNGNPMEILNRSEDVADVISNLKAKECKLNIDNLDSELTETQHSDSDVSRTSTENLNNGSSDQNAEKYIISGNGDMVNSALKNVPPNTDFEDNLKEKPLELLSTKNDSPANDIETEDDSISKENSDIVQKYESVQSLYEKISVIVSNITVNSDVFEKIEEIKRLQFLIDYKDQNPVEINQKSIDNGKEAEVIGTINKDGDFLKLSKKISQEYNTDTDNNIILKDHLERQNSMQDNVDDHSINENASDNVCSSVVNNNIFEQKTEIRRQLSLINFKDQNLIEVGQKDMENIKDAEMIISVTKDGDYLKSSTNFVKFNVVEANSSEETDKCGPILANFENPKIINPKSGFNLLEMSDENDNTHNKPYISEGISQENLIKRMNDDNYKKPEESVGYDEKCKAEEGDIHQNNIPINQSEFFKNTEILDITQSNDCNLTKVNGTFSEYTGDNNITLENYASGYTDNSSLMKDIVKHNATPSMNYEMICDENYSTCTKLNDEDLCEREVNECFRVMESNEKISCVDLEGVKSREYNDENVQLMNNLLHEKAFAFEKCETKDINEQSEENDKTSSMMEINFGGSSDNGGERSEISSKYNSFRNLKLSLVNKKNDPEEISSTHDPPNRISINKNITENESDINFIEEDTCFFDEDGIFEKLIDREEAIIDSVLSFSNAETEEDLGLKENECFNIQKKLLLDYDIKNICIGREDHTNSEKIKCVLGNKRDVNCSEKHFIDSKVIDKTITLEQSSRHHSKIDDENNFVPCKKQPTNIIKNPESGDSADNLSGSQKKEFSSEDDSDIKKHSSDDADYLSECQTTNFSSDENSDKNNHSSDGINYLSDCEKYPCDGPENNQTSGNDDYDNRKSKFSSEDVSDENSHSSEDDISYFMLKSRREYPSFIKFNSDTDLKNKKVFENNTDDDKSLLQERILFPYIEGDQEEIHSTGDTFSNTNTSKEIKNTTEISQLRKLNDNVESFPELKNEKLFEKYPGVTESDSDLECRNFTERTLKFSDTSEQIKNNSEVSQTQNIEEIVENFRALKNKNVLDENFNATVAEILKSREISLASDNQNVVEKSSSHTSRHESSVESTSGKVKEIDLLANKTKEENRKPLVTINITQKHPCQQKKLKVRTEYINSNQPFQEKRSHCLNKKDYLRKISPTRQNKIITGNYKNFFRNEYSGTSQDCGRMNEIEIGRRESIEIFNKKKRLALSDMKPTARVIPITKSESFEIDPRVIENICVKQRKKSPLPQLSRKQYQEVERNLNELMPFELLKDFGKIEGNQALQKSFDEVNLFRNEGDFLEDSPESLNENSSQISQQMTPDRKRILDASRAMRTPFRIEGMGVSSKAHNCQKTINMKYPELDLATYMAKSKIKKRKHVKESLKQYSPRMKGYASLLLKERPTQNMLFKRAISPEELRVKFDNAFKRYAGRGRTNGDLISYKRSTEWLRDAGVIGKVLTSEEANDAFKCMAGVKVALNKGDYRNFLWKLARLKSLNYNEMYESLCSPANCKFVFSKAV